MGVAVKINAEAIGALFVSFITIVAYWYSDVRVIQLESRVISSPMEGRESVQINKRSEATNSFCSVYNLTEQVKANEEMNCITTKTDPSHHICIYDIAQDIFVSRSLAETGQWEPGILGEVADILKTDPEMGLIDIGANIGVFSLFAAKAGHRVVSVEPLIHNIIRLQKAAQIDQTTNKLTLIRNAITNTHTWMRIRRNYKNQGGTSMIFSNPCQGHCNDVIKTIVLNDLLEVITFKSAVMKIDCEGCEHYAFQQADKLLDMVDVKYIFMEWRKMYLKPVKMVEDLIERLFRRGYRPRQLRCEGSVDLNIGQWRYWPEDIKWDKRSNYYQLISYWKNWPYIS